MCGILGSIGNINNKNYFLEKLDLIKHRGPDKKKFFETKVLEKNVFLGHQRLEILDISKGSQPMISNDGKIILIFNGEIYNHNDLRKELSKSYNFKSNNSDTEVIIASYNKWGIEAPSKFNGMWSFALLDKSKKILFLSRDRYGEKPLYYSFNNESFIFGSELNVVASLNKKDLSLSDLNLAKYCCHGFFPGNLTPFKNIFQLDAAENLIYDFNNNNFKKSRFWKYNIEPDYHQKESTIIENLYNLIGRSVEQRLANSDVDVGVFLSGGLDSSIITYFASKFNKNIDTFSLGFDDNSIDESKYSDYISSKFNTNHHKLNFNLKNASDLQNKLFKKIYEPLSDSSMLSYYLLSEFASKKVKVVLGGDASDEIFGGYSTFIANKILNFLPLKLLNKSNNNIKNFLTLIPASNKNMSLNFKLNNFFKFDFSNKNIANQVWLSPNSLNEVNKIFGRNYSYDEIYYESISEWENSSNLDIIDKSLEFYFNFFLKNQILTKTDRLSMLNSLEVRSPFLDYDLVDFVRKLPNKFKINLFRGKYILKKTFQNIFGKKFVNRKKIGFTSPLSKMISDNYLNTDLVNSSDYNYNDYYCKLLISHKKNLSENRLQIWNILNLDNFLKNYENKI